MINETRIETLLTHCESLLTEIKQQGADERTAMDQRGLGLTQREFDLKKREEAVALKLKDLEEREQNWSESNQLVLKAIEDFAKDKEAFVNDQETFQQQLENARNDGAQALLETLWAEVAESGAPACQQSFLEQICEHKRKADLFDQMKSVLA